MIVYSVFLLAVLNSSDTHKSTTIRVKESTKQRITNLDFVKKDSYDEILEKLVKFYEEYSKRN